MSLLQSNSYRWRVVGLLTLYAILNYADRALLPALLPLIRVEFGLSEVMLGALTASFLWCYALGSPTVSFFAERWPRVRVITWSLVLWSTAVILSGLAFSTGQFLVTQGLLGFAECAALPAALALLSAYPPAGRRAMAIGIPLAGCTLGAVAGGLVAGVCGDHVGWRPAFFILGGVGLLLAVGVRMMLRPLALAEQERVAAVDAPRRRAAWGELFRVRSFRIILIGFCCLSVPSWVFASWMPYFFHERYGLSLTGSVLAGSLAIHVAATLGYSLGGFLSDRFSRRARERRMLLQSLCYFAAAPFLLVFASGGGIAVLNGGIFIASLLRGLGSANDQVMVCEILPPGLRMSALGLLNGLGIASGAFGVLMAGGLVKHVGLAAIFAGMAIFYLGSACLSQLGYRRFLAKDLIKEGG